MDLRPDTNGENERAVYSALRDEVLKHTDIQNQLITLSITITGAAFTLGLQNALLPQISQTIIVIYPMLVSFLAFGWVHSARRIFVINQFIKQQTQTGVPPLGIGSWENYLWGDSEGKAQHSSNSSTTGPIGIRKLWKLAYSFNVSYIFGVFALPQILAVLVVWLQAKFVISGLQLIPVLSLVATLVALWTWRTKYALYI